MIVRNDKISPIIYSPEYKDSYDELVYFGLVYSADVRIKEFILVDHSDYRTSELTFNRFDGKLSGLGAPKFDYYAYGIGVNPYSTNILFLDFDSIDMKDLFSTCSLLCESPSVTGIDILATSIGSFHMHVSLVENMNVIFLLESLTNVCQGFVDISIDLGIQILRLSQKFNKLYVNSNKNTKINYVTSIRKKENKLMEYRDWIFPETKKEQINSKKLTKLNLRSLNG